MSLQTTVEKARIALHTDAGGSATLSIEGEWKTHSGLPGELEVEEVFSQAREVKSVEFNVAKLGAWDSGLPVFILACRQFCNRRGIAFGSDNLPAGVLRLMALADAVPEVEGAAMIRKSRTVHHVVGEAMLGLYSATQESVAFLGECVMAFVQVFRGKALYRWSDIFLIVQQCGVEALAIVALINFLVGLILAFVGAVQLEQFGAAIYVADLVAVAMTREMGSIMTAIIVCGRTGAAFAAQLGTMKVNQEIDALKTFGFSAIEFLVFPRLLALILMMPLLCVFADLLGILGGFVVGITLFDLSWVEYYYETINVMTLTHFSIGLVKGSVFGVIIAITGCLRGVQCGNSSAAVGLSATSAVVTGITWIIIADAVFAVLCNLLEI